MEQEVIIKDTNLMIHITGHNNDLLVLNDGMVQ